MISCIAFVPFGVAKPVPDEHELSKDEMDALVKQQQEMSLGDGVTPAAGDMADEDDEGDDESAVPPKQLSNDEFVASLNLDNYDNEEEGAQLMLGGSKLMYHQSNDEDPYITLPDAEAEADGVGDDAEDLIIRPTDKLVLVGKTSEEHSNLEVHIYDEANGSLYVHHDFSLPSFPLSMAWLNRCGTTGGESDGAAAGAEPVQARMGNFVAVGTFQPEIEIWNLDVLNVLEPVASLGGRLPVDPAVAAEAAEKMKARTGKKKKKISTAAIKNALLGDFKPGSHTGAVLTLAWNPAMPNLLASGSEDTTVKLWDIETLQCTQTFTHHSSKVQSLQWNPAEPNILLSGSFDRTVVMRDIRQPASAPVKTFQVDSDIECLKWNPHAPFTFAATTDRGTVTMFDAIGGKSVFTLAAHSEATTGLDFSAGLPNLMATASTDKSVRLWDISNNQPSLIATKIPQVGGVYALAFDSNNPYLLGMAGSKGVLALWDTAENRDVERRFRLAPGFQFTPQVPAAPVEAPADVGFSEPGLKKKKKAKASTASTASLSAATAAAAASPDSLDIDWPEEDAKAAKKAAKAAKDADQTPLQRQAKRYAKKKEKNAAAKKAIAAAAAAAQQ